MYHMHFSSMGNISAKDWSEFIVSNFLKSVTKIHIWSVDVFHETALVEYLVVVVKTAEHKTERKYIKDKNTFYPSFNFSIMSNKC